MSLSNLGLDAFEAIAELGTIVMASQKLGVTQTALTQRIKALETELDSPLFTRSRKGMTLTNEGKTLYEYCKHRRLREEQTIQKIKGLIGNDPVRVRISGPTLQTQTRFFEALSELKKNLPQLFFEFDIDDSNSLLEKLKENKVDLILTSSPPPASVRFKKLVPSEFVLVGTYAWKGRELKEIIRLQSIIDFSPQDPYTMNFLAKNRIHPKSLPERHFINNTHQMLMLVERGLGYAVFDKTHVQEMIRSKKLVNLSPSLKQSVDWYLCWNDSGERLGQTLKKIIEAIN